MDNLPIHSKIAGSVSLRLALCLEDIDTPEGNDNNPMDPLAEPLRVEEPLRTESSLPLETALDKIS